MGILKVTEFAEKHNINRPNIYTYQKRDKLVITQGYIDEDNPVNRLFIESRKRSNAVKPKEVRQREIRPREVKQKQVIPDTTNEPIQAKTEEKITILKADTPESERLIESYYIKDEMLKVDLRIKQLKADVQEGKLVPVDMVKQSVSEIVARFKASFIQQIEQLTRDTLNELQAPNEIITRSCSRIIDISNDVVHRATQETAITMTRIVEESSR